MAIAAIDTDDGQDRALGERTLRPVFEVDRQADGGEPCGQALNAGGDELGGSGRFEEIKPVSSAAQGGGGISSVVLSSSGGPRGSEPIGHRIKKL